MAMRMCAQLPATMFSNLTSVHTSNYARGWQKTTIMLPFFLGRKETSKRSLKIPAMPVVTTVILLLSVFLI